MMHVLPCPVYTPDFLDLAEGGNMVMGFNPEKWRYPLGKYLWFFNVLVRLASC